MISKEEIALNERKHIAASLNMMLSLGADISSRGVLEYERLRELIKSHQIIKELFEEECRRVTQLENEIINLHVEKVVRFPA
jgi:hypothetical protein